MSTTSSAADRGKRVPCDPQETRAMRPSRIGTYVPVNIALPGPLATKLSMPSF
jgi:hypothetical protein